MKPMLCRPYPVAHLTAAATDDSWALQQKMDGRRMLAVCDGGTVTLRNRSGGVAVPPGADRVAAALAPLAATGATVAVDGEYIDGVLYAFDLVTDNPADTFDVRHATLVRILDLLDTPHVVAAPTAYGTADKVALARRVADGGGEGLVARRLAGRYTPGGRSDDCRKLKFTHTADVIVLAVTPDRASVSVGVHVPGSPDPVEVCTVSTHGKPPVSVGDVVEVEYLYATERCRLYQPRIVAVRDDKGPDECTVDQLPPATRLVTAA